MKKTKISTLTSITFWLGWTSVFLWPLSIVPIVTIIFGVITLIKFTKETNKDGRGYAILGLVLGIVFLVVRILYRIYGY
jgi:hypothetical protein